MSGLIVAIDLGTSGSAWAYSFQGQAEEIVILRVPEGCMPSATSNNKTETAVLRSTDGHKVLAFGRAARERFIEESQDFEDATGKLALTWHHALSLSTRTCTKTNQEDTPTRPSQQPACSFVGLGLSWA